MIKEIDLAGVFISPMLGYLAVALVLTGLIRLVLGWIGAYRWIWHRPLFDLSLLVMVLTGLVVWTM
jgi:hypothetical protein